MSENLSGIFVCARGGDAFVRVMGRGSHQNAQPFRQWLQAQIGADCRCLHVDLSQCQGMDSTFLGLLAGFGLKRRAAGGQGALHLFNAGDRHLKSCQSLGLDRLARIDPMRPDDPAFHPPLDSEYCQLPDTDLIALKKPADSFGTAQVMLEAHEDLCATDERNEPKFKDVKQFLREEIARKSEDPPISK